MDDDSMDVDEAAPPAAASASTMLNGNGAAAAADTDVDMGYENCEPQVRRGSMTVNQEKERRASIQAVMADPTMSPAAKRRSVQHLMDGRRGSAVVSDVGSVTQQAMDNTANHSCMYGSGGIINNEQTRRAELQRPACAHYERLCTMIAPCCGAAFGCRICHDECPTLPPKINNGGKRFHRSASLPSSFTSMTEENHHTIDRFAVREIICRECFTRQSSQTNACVSCHVKFGDYHCKICNLWMSNDEHPYHCEQCGFCRVGGRNNFQHCDCCGMCIDKQLYDSHNCKAGKYRSNCPVCQEYLFSSRGASHEMPCGHAIHWECFRQLAVHDSRCPVCKKTAETRDRMMPTWNAMAAGVAMQPVPPELARVVHMTCNDCERNEKNRAWHFLGMQCSNCSSFNTVVDSIVLQGEDAYEFLQNQQLAETMTDGNGSNPQPRRMNRRRSAF